MSVIPRVAGRRGKLPARPPAERFALRYIHEYARTPLPAPAYPIDVTGGIPDDEWGMLGNGADPTCTVAPDGVGDCGYAGREHYKMAKAACYGETEQWQTSDQLVTEYLDYDNGQDDGVVLADVLLAWCKAGRILGFAPVDHTSPVQVDAAMQAFRGVYAGADLTGDAEALFSQGLPWTVADGQLPDETAGHCIVKVRADGDSPGGVSYDGWVTWGAVQLSTRAWTAACLTEAYAVITSEDEAAKIDMAALAADIEALHGT